MRVLVGNTRGLHADPENSDGTGVVVLRGVKRGYSFTVDGPFSIETEDVPEETIAVLPEATTMFQVLVEGTPRGRDPTWGPLRTETSQSLPRSRYGRANLGSMAATQDGKGTTTTDGTTKGI
ncbi:hypothetical protein LN996_01505 [Arthrobacter sp. AK01]|uniref:hypothetical protein n=1 Tax=Arthrobacter sp. AK01 TaxID=2894084 RepID=UPI001E483C9F|nr:hypothetical protein [Arthrobacter sp. AK01]MCD4849480.1 hypothetical protein [Arthrobacter sp. AK01]